MARPAALVGFLLAAGWAGAAQAAFSDRACSPYATEVTAFPTTDALRQAAAATETRLARRGAADPYQDLAPTLDPPTGSGGQPSPAAMAEYCAAAGELMRVSPQGSQLQAQSYLLGAFRIARGAGLQDTASIAAYRLGLVSLAGPTVAGARGGSRTTRGSTAAARNAEQAESAAGGPCDLLLSRTVLTNTNLALSLASLGCSAEQAALAGDSRTAALALLRLARLRLAVAEASADVAVPFRAEAWRAATSGLTLAGGIADPGLRAEIRGRLAMAALDARPDPQPELAAVIAAIREAGPDNSAAQAFAAALAARMALRAGDDRGARALLEQALLFESQRSLPARLPEWRLLLAEADPQHREQHVLAAYEALEAIRPLLPRFDPLTEETAFSLYMRNVFQGAVDVQLAGAQGSAERVRVRDAQQIVEAYRQAELQSVFGSECIPARDPLKPETLAAGEVLLYPILLADRLELLYVAGGHGGAAIFRRLPPNRTVDRQAVAKLVETVVLSLAYDSDDRWRAASRQLYDLLIKPIEGELKPGSQLAIVPDGALRALPFAVLLDEQDRHLIQKTRVSVAPSLTYSQPGGEDGGKGQQLLAASLELEVSLPAGYFEKLEGTGAEARLAAVTDGVRIERSRVLENFKKAELVQALNREPVDVLHLATHASFNGRSDRAFIVANGEVILLSELRQILQDARTRGEELDLLVLSACETAVGDDEASMGLAGAAVQAGAKSAIASLWPVNDIGTAALMKSFYERYRAGRAKGEALREAQMEMIQAGGVNADPNIWAAFTLIGAWR
ncbi:CHAT domain-containing protein [uncultured Phenylobacterium sp.]|uniref:CHAT domain-containing protein n=1 Tax=uncultured Phenylobacterium sp. TaxID=349273 RepID=UPI0025F7F0C5|nr:CHAT domain-containing protein [uncultured Phenylobacterium sp.]